MLFFRRTRNGLLIFERKTLATDNFACFTQSYGSLLIKSKHVVAPAMVLFALYPRGCISVCWVNEECTAERSIIVLTACTFLKVDAVFVHN